MKNSAEVRALLMIEKASSYLIPLMDSIIGKKDTVWRIESVSMSNNTKVLKTSLGTDTNSPFIQAAYHQNGLLKKWYLYLYDDRGDSILEMENIAPMTMISMDLAKIPEFIAKYEAFLQVQETAKAPATIAYTQAVAEGAFGHQAFRNLGPYLSKKEGDQLAIICKAAANSAREGMKKYNSILKTLSIPDLKTFTQRVDAETIQASKAQSNDR